MKSTGISKWLLASVLLVVLAMFYWSSLLQEQDLKKVRQELKELRTEIAGLGQKISREFHHLQAASQKQHKSIAQASHPNVLEEDPYFVKTLPKAVGEIFVRRRCSIAH